jgi:hypothetical protein
MKMKRNRKTAAVAGVFFVIATAAAITGLYLYNPILHNPDFIVGNTQYQIQIRWGAFFEILTAFSVMGTAITLFPVLRKYNEGMAISTVAFRLLEATIIMIGIMSLLTILSLNQQYITGIDKNMNNYILHGRMLVALHDWTFLFGPNIALGPSTLITSYLLYKSQLVPRSISVLGIVAGPLISISGILVMFGTYQQISIFGVLSSLPVFTYEIVLAGWLLVKGFKHEERQIENKVNLQFYANAIDPTPTL